MTKYLNNNKKNSEAYTIVQKSKSMTVFVTKKKKNEMGMCFDINLPWKIAHIR